MCCCADPSNAQPRQGRGWTETSTRSSVQPATLRLFGQNKRPGVRGISGQEESRAPAMTLPRGASRCEITGRRVFGMGRCHVGSRKQRPRDCLLPCRHDPRSPPSAPVSGVGLAATQPTAARGGERGQGDVSPTPSSFTQIHGGNKRIHPWHGNLQQRQPARDYFDGDGMIAIKSILEDSI